MEAAARLVIQDWNGGRMKHYALPPAFDPSILVDVDSLRKELLADADEDINESMLLEGEEPEESAMKIE